MKIKASPEDQEQAKANAAAHQRDEAQRLAAMQRERHEKFAKIQAVEQDKSFLDAIQMASAKHTEIPAEIFQDIIDKRDANPNKCFGEEERVTVIDDYCKAHPDAKREEVVGNVDKAVAACMEEERPKGFFESVIGTFFNSQKGGPQWGAMAGAGIFAALGNWLGKGSGLVMRTVGTLVGAVVGAIFGGHFDKSDPAPNTTLEHSTFTNGSGADAHDHHISTLGGITPTPHPAVRTGVAAGGVSPP